TDPLNCGICVNACPAGRVCCDGACTSTLTDNSNCGACGNFCLGGRTCVAGQCSCPLGQLPCGPPGAEGCIDVQTDPLNCGACGIACDTDPRGRPICSAGVCVVDPVVQCGLDCTRQLGECQQNCLLLLDPVEQAACVRFICEPALERCSDACNQLAERVRVCREGCRQSLQQCAEPCPGLATPVEMFECIGACNSEFNRCDRSCL